ncbi:hypothetical protein [Flavivirga jejuensis]|uniref:Uncharacterized protein n=1 Tax=Flavivirga jejuensis TaxID=870487 RepID=A0ABT8WMQ5_9FLAO|nr:hypothetical protein [Flavivirga jejuensis]MDO5974447.1 hypothetical protein [Flavivirga jejuensis]
MRKFNLIILLLSIITISCNSSDDSGIEEQSGFLRIGEVEFELANGISEDYSDDSINEVYNIDLTFLSSEFTIDGKDYTGNGEGIYFEIYSPTPNKLSTGIYEYNQTGTSLSFDDATVFYKDSDGENLEKGINSGTITVTKSENDYYELTFECVDELSRTITGRYNGNVNYILEPKE